MDDILKMMGPEEPSKPKWQGALEDILWTVVAGAVTKDPLAYPKFKMQQEHAKAVGKTAQLEKIHKVLQIREAMDKRTAERKPFRVETGTEEYEIPGGGVEGAGGEYDTPTPGKEVKRTRPAYTDMGISMGEAKMLGKDALNRLMEARGIGKEKGQKPHGAPWPGTDNKLFQTMTDEKGNVRNIPITTTTREVDPNVGLTEDNLGLQDLVKVVTKQQVREKEKKEDRPPPSPWPSDQGLMTWKKVDGEWVATPVTVPEEATPSMESTSQLFRKPEAEIPPPGKRQLHEKEKAPPRPVTMREQDPKTGNKYEYDRVWDSNTKTWKKDESTKRLYEANLPKDYTSSDVTAAYNVKVKTIKEQMTAEMTREDQIAVAGTPSENLLAMLMAAKVGKSLPADRKKYYIDQLKEADDYYGGLLDKLLGKKGAPKKPEKKTPPPEILALKPSGAGYATSKGKRTNWFYNGTSWEWIENK